MKCEKNIIYYYSLKTYYTVKKVFSMFPIIFLEFVFLIVGIGSYLKCKSSMISYIMVSFSSVCEIISNFWYAWAVFMLIERENKALFLFLAVVTSVSLDLIQNIIFMSYFHRCLKNKDIEPQVID